jgi:hypothetical protein
LKKKFLVIIVEAMSKEWIHSTVGLLVAGELCISPLSIIFALDLNGNFDFIAYINLPREGIDSLKTRVKLITCNPPTTSTNPQPATKFDIFISYCWKNSKLASPKNFIGEIDPREIAQYLSEIIHKFTS